MKIIRNIFIMIICFFSINIISSNEIKLVIVHTNDTHGHPVKFDNYPDNNVGGIPARTTFINELKKNYENVLVLDAGDLNTGRPESNFFRAEPDIIGYNYAGYDAIALGNHEFDNSLEVLKKQIKQAKFPFLSANVKTKNGKYVGKPYMIKRYKGLNVAVFGLTTKETTIVGNPEYIKDLVFEDEVATAQKLVPSLRKKADIVIALVHMGIYENDDEGSKWLAKNADGIDLIIDGHTHTMMEKPVYINNTPIVQAWQWGLVLGKGVFTVNNRKIESFDWESIPVNLKEKVKNAEGKDESKFIDKEIKEDPVLSDQLSKYVDEVENILSEKIAESGALFPNGDVRRQETALGDLVADSMLWYVKNLGVDFAIQNGGGIRTDLPEGEIRKKNIYEIVPFDNSTVVLTLKGNDIKKLFEFIATIPQGKGAFPQVSEGVSFTINYNTGMCEDILINGSPIDDNRTYKIATNSFMATGGDGYEIFKKTTESYDSSMFQRDVLIEYLKTMKTKIVPEIKNRIKVIGSKTAYFFGYNKYKIS